MEEIKTIINWKEYTIYDLFRIHEWANSYTPFSDYVWIWMREFKLTEEEAKAYVDSWIKWPMYK